MDFLTGWGVLLTGIAGVVGVAYTIINGIQVKRRKTGDDLFRRTNALIEHYDKEQERKDAEIKRLETKIERLTDRMKNLEAKNAILVQYLAKAWKQPVDMIEFQLATSGLKEPASIDP